MTSRPSSASGLFVWVWLPEASEPVVAGRLQAIGNTLRFAYGQSYLRRQEAIALYEPELPLERGLLALPSGLTMPGAIRDGSPDAWGRRVILNRIFGVKGAALDAIDLDEASFLLNSGSDRIGALDFQSSAEVYVAREGRATLEELMGAADRVDRNIPLRPELDDALHHGSSIGGARPKALVAGGSRKLIAKFSSTSDQYSVVKGEFVAMRLARLVGLQVAPVEIERVAGRDVLLVERFDRSPGPGGWRRRGMVSALTLLGLDEMHVRYASYADFAERIRHRFEAPVATLHELFGRLVFNILVGNTDDHARNHAAFWTGRTLELTPAYDICPQGRSGGEASQAMLIVGNERSSRIETALAAAPVFRLDESRAIARVRDQIVQIGRAWRSVCDEAGCGPVDRGFFWGRQFLNPYAFTGLRIAAAGLQDQADAIRRSAAG